MVTLPIRRTFAVGLALGLATGGLAAAGVAVAATVSPVIHACAGKNGALRLADRCKHSEKGVTWNVQGPQGDPGPPGSPGAPGAPGAPGTTTYIKTIDIPAGPTLVTESVPGLPLHQTFYARVTCTGAAVPVSVALPIGSAADPTLPTTGAALTCDGAPVTIGPKESLETAISVGFPGPLAQQVTVTVEFFQPVTL